MPSSPRVPALLGAVTIAALALTACAAPAPATENTTGTDEERTLVVYSGRSEDLVGPLIEKFEETSGISVRVRYAGTTEQAAQLLEEGERSPADAFLSQDAGALGALSAADMFATLPGEITDAVPAEYSSQDGSWVGVTGRARVIVFDSGKYAESDIPGDVTKLVEPEWRGKVGIAPTNASFQAFVTAMRVTEGEDAARAWLEGLIANDVQIYPNNGGILEAVETGALDVGLINHYYWAAAEGDPADQRAQLKFGDPGSVSALVNVTGAGVLSSAVNSDEAIEFVEFLVSEDAQTYFLEETLEYPLIAGLPSPSGVPPLEDLGAPSIDLSDLASLEETVALITEVGLI